MAFNADVKWRTRIPVQALELINELLFDKAELLPLRPGGPKSGRVAGTAYPALQMKGVADNVALWPDFVDSSLKITSVRYVLVERAEEGQS